MNTISLGPENNAGRFAARLIWDPIQTGSVLFALSKTCWEILSALSLHIPLLRRWPFVAADSFSGDFNLDLTCYIYGDDGEHFLTISPNPDHMVDDTGKIYHSGDNTDGYGRIDEEINIDLKSLPAHYKTLIFTVASQNKHYFKDIPSAEIRIDDCVKNTTILTRDIGHLDDKGHNAYIAFKIFRHNGEWLCGDIGEMAPANSTRVDILETYL